MQVFKHSKIKMKVQDVRKIVDNIDEEPIFHVREATLFY